MKLLILFSWLKLKGISKNKKSMKKIISIFTLTVALSTVSFAQNFSVDYSITSSGVCPKVAEGFKEDYVNTDIEQVVELRINTDTIIDLFSVNISNVIHKLIVK